MGNTELRAEAGFDGGYGCVGVAAIGDFGVERGDGARRAQRPGMDVVDVFEVFHMGEEVGRDGGRIEPIGRALHEDVGGVARYAPCAAQDEKRDEDGEDRINRHPA